MQIFLNNILTLLLFGSVRYVPCYKTHGSGNISLNTQVGRCMSDRLHLLCILLQLRKSRHRAFLHLKFSDVITAQISVSATRIV